MVRFGIIIRVKRTISASEAIADQLLDELAPLVGGERAAFAQRCHERSISMPHLHLMSLLDAHGPLAMSRAAELLGCGLPTATGLVSRMEERGLVTRAHDAGDRRVVTVHLTASGSAELQDLNQARRLRMAAALQHVTPAQRRQLLASIRALRAAFARINQEGAPE